MAIRVPFQEPLANVCFEYPGLFLAAPVSNIEGSPCDDDSKDSSNHAIKVEKPRRKTSCKQKESDKHNCKCIVNPYLYQDSEFSS